MTDKARRIRNRLIAGLVTLVILNVALAAANELLPAGRVDGDPGSSFVTTPAGTAAWFELLDRTGRQPQRLTIPLEEADIDPAVTLVVTDVWFTERPSVQAVLDFVQAGGRVVVAAPEGAAGDLGEALLGQRSVEITDAAGGRYEAVADNPAVRGVATVESAGLQAWEATSETESLLTNEYGEALAISHRIGRGTAVLVADSTVFSNAYLAEADNAAFAVAVLGERPALFDEYSHGYVDDLVTEPLLPRSWRWTLYLLAAATLVFLVAAGRRFGPPEATARTLPPPRRWFVESLATTLARTDLADATEPLRLEAQRILFDRTGLTADASHREILAAGQALGIAGPDLEALLRPAGDGEDAMAISRVMAAVRRRAGSGARPSPAMAIVPSRSSEEAPG